jgi:hypothetical protein
MTKNINVSLKIKGSLTNLSVEHTYTSIRDIEIVSVTKIPSGEPIDLSQDLIESIHYIIEQSICEVDIARAELLISIKQDAEADKHLITA